MNLKVSEPYQSSASSEVFSDQDLASKDRQYAWEKGQIDYLGIDKFENIQTHLTKIISEDNGSNGKSTAAAAAPAPEKDAAKPAAAKTPTAAKAAKK